LKQIRFVPKSNNMYILIVRINYICITYIIVYVCINFYYLIYYYMYVLIIFYTNHTYNKLKYTRREFFLRAINHYVRIIK